MNEFDVTIIKRNIQKDLLARIILNLRHMKLTSAKARRIAKEFILIQPFENVEILFDRLHVLSLRYSEVNEVYQKYAREYFQYQKEYQYKNIQKELLEMKGGE